MILAGNVFITNPLNLTILVIKTLPARVIVCVYGRKPLSLIEANRVSPQLYVNTEEINYAAPFARGGGLELILSSKTGLIRSQYEIDR